LSRTPTTKAAAIAARENEVARFPSAGNGARLVRTHPAPMESKGIMGRKYRGTGWRRRSTSIARPATAVNDTILGIFIPLTKHMKEKKMIIVKTVISVGRPENTIEILFTTLKYLSKEPIFSP
jgi:hypothetical protein